MRESQIDLLNARQTVVCRILSAVGYTFKLYLRVCLHDGNSPGAAQQQLRHEKASRCSWATRGPGQCLQLQRLHEAGALSDASKPNEHLLVISENDTVE